MSVIAQRKTEQTRGSETILFFMGITFIVLDIILVIFVLVSSNELDRIIMSPILYYLVFGGLFLGMGSFLKEHNYDLRYFKNWMYSIMFIGILAGIVIGTIVWEAL